MIEWSTVAPALRTILSGIATATTESPEFLGRWADKQSEFIHSEVQRELIMRVTRVADIDGYRSYEENEDQELIETISGMSEFTLEVRVDSHEHAEESDSWAWSMIERIRTSLRLRRVIDALLAVEVGIVSVGPARDVSYRYDKNRVNAALFELTCNASFELSDSVTTDWFEKVELTSEIKGPDGVTLPSPPNVTALVVGPIDDE